LGGEEGAKGEEGGGKQGGREFLGAGKAEGEEAGEEDVEGGEPFVEVGPEIWLEELGGEVEGPSWEIEKLGLGVGKERGSAVGEGVPEGDLALGEGVRDGGEEGEMVTAKIPGEGPIEGEEGVTEEEEGLGGKDGGGACGARQKAA
jgi:hypothetical protein